VLALQVIAQVKTKCAKSVRSRLHGRSSITQRLRLEAYK
jgi:hypothetical protein